MKVKDKRSSFAEKPAKTGSEIFNEIASISKDYTISTYGGILTPSDETLSTRGGGESYAIYDKIERDCHAFAVLQKRKLAIIAREYTVDAESEDSKDVQVADFVRNSLEKHIDALSEKLLDATLKGFSVVEVIWERKDGYILPKEFKGRNQRRFQFSEDGTLRLKTLSNMLPGEELPERKFIVHRFGQKYDDPYGLGLGTRLFWPVWFKRQGISFWLQFCDKFGSPTVVGKYPAGTPLSEQNRLLAACEAIRREAGVVIPEGMMIELLEAARTGTVATYDGLVRYMDEQISEAVLGETGSTNQSGSDGSRARDEVGNEVRLEIAKSDADNLSETINSTIVQWIVDFNFPGSNCPMFWRNFDEDEDLEKKANRDAALANTRQIRFTKQYFMKAYGFEEEDIEELEPSTQPQTFGFADPPAVIEVKQTNRKDQEILFRAADDLASNYKKILGKRLDDIRAVLEETGDFETFKKHLAMMLKDAPPKEFVETIGRARFAAQVLGRTGKA